jgi:enoyl-CoA hydratase/carnithine racemase
MSIKTATVNGVATLEIARPEKKNAITVAMYQAMADALKAAKADSAVRAVLITGQPGIFTSGNDLEDFMNQPRAGMDSPVFQFMRALLDCDKPVVAAVTGAAIGIGTTLLLPGPGARVRIELGGAAAHGPSPRSRKTVVG